MALTLCSHDFCFQHVALLAYWSHERMLLSSRRARVLALIAAHILVRFSHPWCRDVAPLEDDFSSCWHSPLSLKLSYHTSYCLLLLYRILSFNIAEAGLHSDERSSPVIYIQSVVHNGKGTLATRTAASTRAGRLLTLASLFRTAMLSFLTQPRPLPILVWFFPLGPHSPAVDLWPPPSAVSFSPNGSRVLHRILYPTGSYTVPLCVLASPFGHTLSQWMCSPACWIGLLILGWSVSLSGVMPRVPS
jgi:hypothetical protein